MTAPAQVSRLTGIAMLLAIAAGAIAALWHVPLSNDVSYQYWVARQLRGGADFGRDIVEVNPPLWFWEAALVSWIADALHVAYEPVIVVVMVLRAGVATALTMLCLPGLTLRRRLVAGAGLMAMLCILPVRDLGQRDVIMLLGAIPYAAIVAMRREGAGVGCLVAGVIGVAAGYGIALKPHFLIVPLLLEGWLLLTLRRDYGPFRSETVAIACVVALYAIAVTAFAPHYLSGAMQLAGQTYGAFGPGVSSLIMAQPYAPVWGLAAAILLTRWRTMGHAPRAAAILALACGLSYVVQGKGFSYHAAPVTVALLWALWLTVCEGRAIAPGVLRVLSGMLIVATCAMAWMIGPYRPDDLGPISKRLDALNPGSSLAVISAHSWDAFPRVEDQRLVWPFRAASLWTIPAIVQSNDRELAAQTLDAIARDLRCSPPHAIVIDDAERAADTAGRGFDYGRFIAQDARIRAVLVDYRITGRFGGMTLLETDQPKPASSNCRSVAIRPDFKR